MEATKIDALLRNAGWNVKSSRLLADPFSGMDLPWYEVSLTTGNQAQVRAPTEWDAYQDADRQLRDNEEHMRRYNEES